MELSFSIRVLAQFNSASAANKSKQTTDAASTQQFFSSIFYITDWICTSCG
jgi:hypothetical protein